MFKVSSIIITYNPDIIKLHQLLDSLFEQNTTIIIVDNYSSNISSIASLVSNKCNVNLIKLNENFGIAYAQNIGIKLAEKKSTHVVLFDQDSIPPPKYISMILEEENNLLSKGYNVGAIGPSFYDDKTNCEYPVAVINKIFIKKIFPSHYSESVKCSFIIASGSLIRVSIIKKVGYMLENLFIDYVDIEWCLRAKYHGYDIFVSPNIKMKHSIGDNRKKIHSSDISFHNFIRCYYIMRNGFIISRFAYIPFGFRVRNITYAVMKNLYILLYDRDVLKKIKYSLLGVLHGVLNKSGKFESK